MADKPLFNLDAEGRWRLAYDPLQWIVQRRKTLPRPSEVGDSAEPRWRTVSFIGSEKRVLRRVLDEKGVVLTMEALVRFDALPERFMAFLAEIDSPAPENGRTARSRPLDGPGHQPGDPYNCGTDMIINWNRGHAGTPVGIAQIIVCGLRTS